MIATLNHRSRLCPMKKSFPIYPALIVLGLTLLCLYTWLSTKPANISKASNKNRVFEVTTIHPTIKAVPLTIKEVGSVEAEQSVSLTPQISGTIKAIHFQQGQDVAKDQLLFEIDPRVYATAVEQAQANLQRDQAQLKVLEATAQRYQDLAKLEYVTQQQSEEAQAAALAQQATAASDKALLEQAQIQLGYTAIRAPIAGKASNITVHVGDLVTANSNVPLVSINGMDPVLVSFNVGQDQLTQVLQYQKSNTLEVDVRTDQQPKTILRGELAAINNSVNAQTGTVELKAKVANPNLNLWPGQLVNVRLQLALEPNRVVIPNSAVQMGQKGSYVYLAKAGKAVIQPITVARQTSHDTVVSSGLKGGEDIIAVVPPGLTEGKAVKVGPKETIH